MRKLTPGSRRVRHGNPHRRNEVRSVRPAGFVQSNEGADELKRKAANEAAKRAKSKKPRASHGRLELQRNPHSATLEDKKNNATARCEPGL